MCPERFVSDLSRHHTLRSPFGVTLLSHSYHPPGPDRISAMFFERTGAFRYGFGWGENGPMDIPKRLPIGVMPVGITPSWADIFGRQA